MNIPLDEVIFFDAITSGSTGAATDADSTPTFAVYEESTDTDIGVGGNLTKRTSLAGNYRGTFTLSAANGFEVGKWYSIVASATVGAVAGKAVVKNFRVVAAEATAGYGPLAPTQSFNNTGQTTPLPTDTRGQRWYVRTTGNNSNSGRLSSPKLTIAAAVSAAQNGDTIDFDGTFTEQVNLLAVTKTLHFRGANRETSIIQYSATVVYAYHGCSFKHLQITTTATGDTDQGINASSMSGVLVDDCKIRGYWDCIESSSGSGMRILNSDLLGNFDAVNLNDHKHFLIDNCYLYTDNTYSFVGVPGGAEMRGLFAQGECNGIVRNTRMRSERLVASDKLCTAARTGRFVIFENSSLEAIASDAGNTGAVTCLVNSVTSTGSIVLRGVRFELTNSGSGTSLHINSTNAVIHDHGSNVNRLMVIGLVLGHASDDGLHLFGKSTAGSTTTATLPVGASATDDFYKGWEYRNDTNGETAIIASYVGSTRVATFDHTLRVSAGTTRFRMLNTNKAIGPDGVSAASVAAGAVTKIQNGLPTSAQVSTGFASLSGLVGAGTGDTLVNQNTGGTDNLRFTTAGGIGIDDATVNAYLKTEYDANAVTAESRGQVFTAADGRWTSPMMLDTGFVYTFVFSKTGYQSSTVEQAV